VRAAAGAADSGEADEGGEGDGDDGGDRQQGGGGHVDRRQVTTVHQAPQAETQREGKYIAVEW
jgi:hypothetical protein